MPFSSATCRTLCSIASRVGLLPHAFSGSEAGSGIGEAAQKDDAGAEGASAARAGSASARITHNNTPLAFREDQHSMHTCDP